VEHAELRGGHRVWREHADAERDDDEHEELAEHWETSFVQLLSRITLVRRLRPVGSVRPAPAVGCTANHDL
jgi:hypothetical protein